jgi:signal transduction histidine kinase
VLAIPAVLTQCVSNLLGNAVKFVAPGVKPHIKVYVAAHWARIAFKDNGLGIDKEQHEAIFGIFQRVNKSYEGTGIGLSNVRKGMERMGCAVGLESAPGKGSTFWLELKRPNYRIYNEPGRYSGPVCR